MAQPRRREKFSPNRGETRTLFCYLPVELIDEMERECVAERMTKTKYVERAIRRQIAIGRDVRAFARPGG